MILTSSNGVRYFFEILQEVTGNQKLPQNLQIAVIGEKTQKTLAEFGYSAAFVNPGSTAEDFVEPFARQISILKNKTKDSAASWKPCPNCDSGPFGKVGRLYKNQYLPD
jgi:uroporphyrinogen-III synthase